MPSSRCRAQTAHRFTHGAGDSQVFRQRVGRVHETVAAILRPAPVVDAAGPDWSETMIRRPTEDPIEPDTPEAKREPILRFKLFQGLFGPD